MERLNLKVFRVKNKLTQVEMAEKLKISKATYIAIEKGQRDCTLKFFNGLQREFNIDDADMWELTKKEGE